MTLSKKTILTTNYTNITVDTSNSDYTITNHDHLTGDSVTISATKTNNNTIQVTRTLNLENSIIEAPLMEASNLTDTLIRLTDNYDYFTDALFNSVQGWQKTYTGDYRESKDVLYSVFRSNPEYRKLFITQDSLTLTEYNNIAFLFNLANNTLIDTILTETLYNFPSETEIIVSKPDSCKLAVFKPNKETSLGYWSKKVNDGQHIEHHLWISENSLTNIIDDLKLIAQFHAGTFYQECADHDVFRLARNVANNIEDGEKISLTINSESTVFHNPLLI